MEKPINKEMDEFEEFEELDKIDNELINDISSLILENNNLKYYNEDTSSISTTSTNLSNYSTISKKEDRLKKSFLKDPKFEVLERCDDKDVLEAGIDEAGRGCLCGRVYTAAVILPETFPDNMYKHIRDSKKISKEKRKILSNYIKVNAVSYCITYSEPEEIDEINILQATMKSMHKALDGLSMVPEGLLVDGNYFKTYRLKGGMMIPFRTVEGGDNKYMNIAAASILAKVAHDEYINDILEKEPELEKYGWRKNMGYGTADHINAIKKYGICKYHRKSFGPCK